MLVVKHKTASQGAWLLGNHSTPSPGSKLIIEQRYPTPCVLHHSIPAGDENQGYLDGRNTIKS
jgi:hypothetical protein